MARPLKFLSHGISDHLSAVTSFGEEMNFGHQPFNLFNFCADNDEILFV